MMYRRSRTGWMPLVLGAALAVLASAAAAEEPFTFVSIPDWLNADIGDITGLPSYDGGGNSWSPSYQVAMDFVLDNVAAESPEFVLVAGDMVNGHWNQDVEGREIFGPTGTRAQKADAINNAADFYFTEWKQRFDARGLTVHTAVGDHELGDNNWNAGSDKAHLVSTFKDVFTRHFTKDAGGSYIYAERPVGTAYEGTAYAFQQQSTLFVTVDVFRQDDPDTTLHSKTGSVKADVTGGQLTWLQGVLADAQADPTVDHVIVQGHTPVLAPVRYQNSSNLTMPGHENTEFWQTLEAYGVDLYLCGEVHDMTASNHGGVEQVAHGGIMGYADDINYMVVTVDGDRLDLELKAIDMSLSDTKLWQCGLNRPRDTLTFDDPAYQTVGTLTIDKSSGQTEYLNRSGFFVWYGTYPEPEPGLLVHLALDEAPGATAIHNAGNTGSMNDGEVTGTAVVTGKFGNARQFDGDDRVLCGSTPVTGGSVRTTSAWVKTTTGTPDYNGITMFTFGNNSAGRKWDFDLDEGKLEVGIGNGRSEGGAALTANDGDWHMVTAVLPVEGGTIDDVLFYIDAQLVAKEGVSKTTTVDTAGTGGLILGHAANEPFFQAFIGTLDDVAIWNVPLSPTEVKALFNLGDTPAVGYDAGMVNAMLLAFDAGEDVLVDGTWWYYSGEAAPGSPGDVVDLGEGDYAVNLGGGAGLTTVPEPATLLLLTMGALGLAVRRRTP